MLKWNLLRQQLLLKRRRMIIQNILKRKRALQQQQQQQQNKRKNSFLVVKKKYTHLVNCKTTIHLNNKENFNLRIVYFINCLVNTNYYTWLENQINLVKNFNAPIYIVATISPDEEATFRQRISQLFPKNNIIVECYYHNEFEYRGILKAWELGQVYNKKNDIILYFHSNWIP
jgi:hypothetical protein